METLAHNNIYSYRNDRSVKRVSIALTVTSSYTTARTRCLHRVRRARSLRLRRRSLTLFGAAQRIFRGHRVTYVFKGKAGRPRHPDDRNVGYELLPIYEHWWLRAHGAAKQSRAFDAYYAYEPYGGRPRPATRRLQGPFSCRRHGSNKAKPFWGWHDNRTRKRKVLATGQWGLDPAYAVSRNLRFPGRFPWTTPTIRTWGSRALCHRSRQHSGYHDRASAQPLRGFPSRPGKRLHKICQAWRVCNRRAEKAMTKGAERAARSADACGRGSGCVRTSGERRLSGAERPAAPE